jgi:hypothetical protein
LSRENTPEQRSEIERLREKLSRAQDDHDKTLAELDSTYRHLRAVIENCKHSPVEAIRHQLVGLLPEVQGFEPEVEREMREKGLGDLVERQRWMVQGNWSDYGYGEPPQGWETRS